MSLHDVLMRGMLNFGNLVMVVDPKNDYNTYHNPLEYYDIRTREKIATDKIVEWGGINIMDEKKTTINIEVLNSRDNSAIIKAYHDRLVEDMTEDNIREPKSEDGS